MPKIAVIGDDSGFLTASLQALLLKRAQEQAQCGELVGEGVTLVGISISMLGSGSGIPLEEPADPVCSGDPWVPFPGDIQKDE